MNITEFDIYVHDDYICSKAHMQHEYKTLQKSKMRKFLLKAITNSVKPQRQYKETHRKYTHNHGTSEVLRHQHYSFSLSFFLANKHHLYDMKKVFCVYVHSLMRY